MRFHKIAIASIVLVAISAASAPITARALPQEILAQHQHPGSQPPQQKEKPTPPPAPHQHPMPAGQPQGQMGGMKHHEMMMPPTTFIEAITHHSGAGTSVEPISTPSHMLMTMRGKWMLMFHGVAFVNSLQQSGPRGYDKIFSTNWLMPMAQRELGRGTFTARAMLSLEPATVTRRRYPEIFQLGETAYGEQRRLEIAMALAQAPRLLLLDEPFAGLSREERRDLQAVLAAIPREVTVLMIEHDMDVALSFAERITVLHYGQVIVEGTRGEIVVNPRVKEIYLGE